MDQALRLAESVKAQSGTGPALGCIVVKDDVIIGEGTNTMALERAVAEAGSQVLAADIYLTFESLNDIAPLLRSPARSLYIAVPDPLSTGRLVEELRNAGIQVLFGDLEERAYQLNQDYFHSRIKKSPYVIAQWAMTLDGKIATSTGDSKWISSDQALEHSHHVRSQVNAIMVGGNTVRHDNPHLTIRHVEHEGPQPIPIILTASGKIPLDSHLITNSQTLVITSHLAQASMLQELDKNKIQHLQFPLKDGLFDLTPIFEELYAQFQFKSILAEGGHQLLSGLYDADLIHEVHTYIAPKLMGGRHSLSPIAGQDIESMDHAWQLHSRRVIDLDPDIGILAKTPLTPMSYADFKETL